MNEIKHREWQHEQTSTQYRLVPDVVVERLAIYLRELTMLIRKGDSIISSQQLANRIGASSAQVRKDLSYFGGFGKQGSGYAVVALRDALCKILHLKQVWSVVLVGVGHLGNALIHNTYVREQGFRIDAVFDNDPNKIGQWVGQFQIADANDLEAYVDRLACQIGIITTDAQSAQHVADRMVAAGILCILNYTSTTLYVPENVRVQSIDPLLHLYQLTYHLAPETEKPRQSYPAGVNMSNVKKGRTG